MALSEVVSVRARMIAAGEKLFAQRGYGVTMLEVMVEAGTPRGSIYYHFPNGKEQLAVEVARKVGDDIERLVDDIAEKSADPVTFLLALIDFQTRKMVDDEFREGCPMLGITASVDIESPELHEAVAGTFERWVRAVSVALRTKGVPGGLSSDVASTLVSAIEGAMVVCRATRTIRPLERLHATAPSLIAAYGAQPNR